MATGDYTQPNVWPPQFARPLATESGGGTLHGGHMHDGMQRQASLSAYRPPTPGAGKAASLAPDPDVGVLGSMGPGATLPYGHVRNRVSNPFGAAIDSI